jgi:hypothetical protein
MSAGVPYSAGMTTDTRHTDTMMSTQHPPAPERVSRAEAARRIGVSHTTLDRYLAEGILAPIRTTVGRRTWILATDVERVRRARLGLDQ